MYTTQLFTLALHTNHIIHISIIKMFQHKIFYLNVYLTL